MSCHGTPGNRAATSIACALSHTASDDVSRRFHDLKREGIDATPPSEEEVLNWLDRQTLAVRTDETLSAWRIERLLGRISEAREEVQTGNLPDGPTWHAWMNLRAACDDAHTHAWLVETAGLSMPIGEATPNDIDEKLADLWSRINREREMKRVRERDLHHARRNVGRYGITESTIAQREASVAQSEATLDSLTDEAAPYENEYARRGRWARYFRVVTSGEGHVHSSMSCHSCYPTTTYVWLPTLSGQGADEAVDSYGSEMCSHCFPGVLTHPRYQSRGRIAEEAAQARAVEKAERDRIKAAKGITNPDGAPLSIGRGRYPETIKSEVTAQRTLIDRLVTLRTDLSEEGRARQVAEHESYGHGIPTPEYVSLLQSRAQEAQSDADLITAALSHKRGVSVDEIKAAVEAKVAAKARQIERERAAWASRNP